MHCNFCIFLSYAYAKSATTSIPHFQSFPQGLSQIPGMEGIEHVSTFKTVVKFLAETAQNEILHGHQEEFTRWKCHAKDFTATLLEEMKKYVCQQYPFNNKVNNNYRPAKIQPQDQQSNSTTSTKKYFQKKHLLHPQSWKSC